MKTTLEELKRMKKEELKELLEKFNKTVFISALFDAGFVMGISLIINAIFKTPLWISYIITIPVIIKGVKEINEIYSMIEKALHS